MPKQARRLIASGDFQGRENESLVRWLMADKSLAKRLLLWCNTPMFNASRPYESIAQAAALMDGRELVQVLIVAAARGFFLPDVQIDIYRRSLLWSHSAAVGTVSAMISRTCGICDPSQAFVAGALHDIGILANERLNQSGFQQFILQIDQLTPTTQVELDFQGWDHTELGEAILDQWGMPDEIKAAARLHHDADAADKSPHAQIASIVSLANFLCSRSGWSSLGTHNQHPPNESTLRHLEIDADLLALLWQQLPTALESAKHLQ